MISQQSYLKKKEHRWKGEPSKQRQDFLNITEVCNFNKPPQNVCKPILNKVATFFFFKDQEAFISTNDTHLENILEKETPSAIAGKIKHLGIHWTRYRQNL